MCYLQMQMISDAKSFDSPQWLKIIDPACFKWPAQGELKHVYWCDNQTCPLFHRRAMSPRRAQMMSWREETNKGTTYGSEQVMAIRKRFLEHWLELPSGRCLWHVCSPEDLADSCWDGHDRACTAWPFHRVEPLPSLPSFCLLPEDKRAEMAKTIDKTAGPNKVSLRYALSGGNKALPSNDPSISCHGL